MKWTLLPATEFERYQAQWDDLNRASGGTPILNSTFVKAIIKHFANGKELLAIAEEPKQPTALAIITQQKFGAWTTFQPSQAPVGCWVQAAEADTSLLTDSLLSSLPGIVLIFSLTQQDPALLPRPTHSVRLTTLDYIETAKIPVEVPFDNYWSARSKNLRQNLRRQRNRLEREGISPRLTIVKETSQIKDAIRDYGELESAGWKAQGNTAVHIDNHQGRFYTDLLETFCRNSKGLIFQYHYNDQLVAMDLCVTSDDSLIILKTTYDETINTSSPAMLMRQEAFEYIFENRLVGNIEFYGPVMDWHKKWADDTRIMYHINRYRYGWLNKRKH